MPKPTTNPRSVLVVSDSDYRAIASDSAAVSLLEETDSVIVPLTRTPDLNEALVVGVRDLLRSAGQLSADTLLVRNPYSESKYEYADVAIESFTGEKYNTLANVARLLGAKSVKFTEVSVEQTESDWLAGIKANLPVGGGDAEARREVKRRVEHTLEGDHVFTGSEPDVEAAQELLLRRNLQTDSQLSELVEMRTGKNLILEYRMTMNGTKEADASFRAALNIANASALKVLNIGAEFSRKVKSMKSVDVKIEIKF